MTNVRVTWQGKLCVEVGRAAGGFPIMPNFAGGVPNCDEECPYHDGKRCEILGLRAPTICEPAVGEMGRILDAGTE